MFETISYITLPKKAKNWKIIWFQKRPPDTFCRKRCSRKFCKVHRKTPMFESLFNKVADLFSLATLLKRDSPTCFFFCVQFANFLRTPISKNIGERLTASLMWNMSYESSIPFSPILCVFLLSLSFFLFVSVKTITSKFRQSV